jgi:hypothetical protein
VLVRVRIVQQHVGLGVPRNVDIVFWRGGRQCGGVFRLVRGRRVPGRRVGSQRSRPARHSGRQTEARISRPGAGFPRARGTTVFPGGEVDGHAALGEETGHWGRSRSQGPLGGTSADLGGARGADCFLRIGSVGLEMCSCVDFHSWRDRHGQMIG